MAVSTNLNACVQVFRDFVCFRIFSAASGSFQKPDAVESSSISFILDSLISMSKIPPQGLYALLQFFILLIGHNSVIKILAKLSVFLKLENRG
jgi:hypothetical protein